MMATGQRFSLTWNDYKASLVSAFESIRGDNEFVDVTLGCEGQTFFAHKMLLSACSPFFRNLLRANPSQHPIIIIRETNAADLRAILEFMYSGEVSVEEEQLDSFLKSSAALQIRGLTESGDQGTQFGYGPGAAAAAAAAAASAAAATGGAGHYLAPQSHMAGMPMMAGGGGMIHQVSLEGSTDHGDCFQLQGHHGFACC